MGKDDRCIINELRKECYSRFTLQLLNGYVIVIILWYLLHLFLQFQYLRCKNYSLGFGAEDLLRVEHLGAVHSD